MTFLQKVFVSFIKSKWHAISYLVLYTIMFLIPLYYATSNTLPPQAQLNHTEGVFHKINIPRKGSIIRLSTANGDMDFSCKSSVGFYNYLPIREDKLHFAEGKLATVYWYSRDIYIGKSVNYIVELKVGNKMIITRSMTGKSLNIEYKIGIFISFIAAIMFIVLYIYHQNIAKRMTTKP